MKILRPIGSLVALTMLLLPAACGHSAHKHDHEGEEIHEGEEHHDEDGDAHKGEDHGNDVVMNEAAMKAASIRLEEAQEGEFASGIKTTGVIENPNSGERIVAAPASGIVSVRGGLLPGSPVKAGEHLFSISSKGIEQGDASASVGVDLALAEKELKRAEELIKDNLISRKEYERIRTEAERARLQASSVSAKGRSGVGVSAPIGGYLVSLDVKPGEFVNMGDRLGVVASGRRLILRADVSERYRSMLPEIGGGNIRVAGREEAVELGSLGVKVVSGASSAMEGSHYYPVYLEFDNPGGLAGGVAAEVWLTGRVRSGVISLPKSAIIEEGGYHYVYIEEEHGVFEKKEVKLGGFDGVRYEILSGVEPGEKVAVEGALKIKMAGMGSSIQGHHHHH